MKCGIVFSKYRQPGTRPEIQPVIQYNQNSWFTDLFLYVKEDINPIAWGASLVLFGVTVFLGLKYIFSPIENNEIANTFLHLVNLPFHEAGHIFFKPFGRVITSLGGSLAQLLMPFICMLVLLLNTRDTFGASVTFWWVGQNFIDMAPYINDARSLSLPLIGGNFGYSSPYGFHDWEFILTETGLLQYDHFLARLSHVTGSVIIVASFIWGGIVLYSQYKNLKS